MQPFPVTNDWGRTYQSRARLPPGWRYAEPIHTAMIDFLFKYRDGAQSEIRNDLARLIVQWCTGCNGWKKTILLTRPNLKFAMILAGSSCNGAQWMQRLEKDNPADDTIEIRCDLGTKKSAALCRGCLRDGDPK